MSDPDTNAARVKSQRLLFMSRGLAQYRFKMTEAVSEALGNGFQLIASPVPSTDLWEVDWGALQSRTGHLIFRELQQVGILDLWRGLLLRSGWIKAIPDLSARPLRVSRVCPDLLLIHEYSPPMLLLALYAKLAGIPCGVFTELGRDMLQHGIKPFARLLHTLAAWLTDFQVANTLGATKPYGAPDRPVFYFPYGVDTLVFRAKENYPDQEEVILLVVGQYIPRKGVDLLLKSLQYVRQRTNRKFRLRLVGNQSEEWIRGEVRKSGLVDQVDVVGILRGQKLVKEYQDADVFVLPCRFDTFGVVVAEAASCGLPLVISKHAGAANVYVEEGINGWIVDPENFAECATHLMRLIEENGLRKKMGRASREVAEKFCVRNQAEKFSDWLQAHYLSPQ